MDMPIDKPCFTRRRAVQATAAALLARVPGVARAHPAAALDRRALARELAAIEGRAGGRLGVAVFDGRGTAFGHRADERFGLCSTFKLPLAAAVLHAVDAGRLARDLWVPYTAADLVPHAPVTGPRLKDGGMPLLALAEAAQKLSDNVAANLLLGLLGGPAGFTRWLRDTGDGVTRLDRLEPDMNRVLPGEVQDSSTPAAMAATAWRLLEGDVLQPTSRRQLATWAEDTRTGRRRLRAGLPPGWRAGDKTGTAMHPLMPDKINDVALVWPPAGRAPFALAAYFDGPRRGSADIDAAEEAVLAEVGRTAARWDGG